MGGGRARWDLGVRDMERLLTEAARFRGESLWQDAWRRLRRQRSSWWSLVFLAAFAAVSLLAPLLPLPSPTAFEQTGMPQPPVWWGGGQSELREEARGKLEPGTRPTRSLLGGAVDDGWRHRAVVRLEAPAAEAERTTAAALALVAEVSGRRAAVEVLDGEDAGTLELHVAVPLVRADRPRVDWIPTGRSGRVVVLHGRDGEDRERAALLCDLPLDPDRVEHWSVRSLGREHRLFLRLLPESAEAEPIGLAYDFRLDVGGGDGPPWQVDALSLGGRALPHVDQEPDAQALDPERWLAGFPMPPAVGRAEGDWTLRLEGEGQRIAFRRVTVEAREHRARRTEGLEGRVAAALGSADLPAGTRLAGVLLEEGYTWDLGLLDRLGLEARGRLFGLWQASGWAGSDAVGRDLLARIVWGSRTSILVALAATLCSLVIGVTYGALSGLLGGRIDNLMMRVVDMLYSVPFIFVVIFLITIVGEYRTLLEDRYGIDREVVFFVVIGAIYWLTMARVVRGQVLALEKAEFIEAARVLGASTARILFVHLVPNVLSIVIVYLTLTIPAVMLFEAFLSFLGLGIEPPQVSWGLLASDSTEAISPVRTFWWLVAFPAAAMGATLLALNVLGDGLRDALDPRLRGKD